MLVLSTKMEDGVQIGDDIRITVIDVRPRNVRLGIEAPRSICIKRDPAASRLNRRPGQTGVSRESATVNAAVATTPSSRSSSASDPNGRAMSLLVISRDQPLLSRLNSELRRDRSAELAFAESMTAAKRRLEATVAGDSSSHSDIVLLDADLAPQTAVVFLHWMRRYQLLRTVPILVLRSNGRGRPNATLMAAGANVIVNKDQHESNILRSVRAAIEMWRYAEPPTEHQRPATSFALQEAVA